MRGPGQPGSQQQDIHASLTSAANVNVGLFQELLDVANLFFAIETAGMFADPVAKFLLVTTLVVTHDGIGQLFRVSWIDQQAGLTVDHRLGQATDARRDHGRIEAVRDRHNSALACLEVRQHHDIGSGKVDCDLLIADVFVFEADALSQIVPIYERGVLRLVVIELPGDEQTAVYFAQNPWHGFDQHAQSLVRTNQPEKQDQAPLGRQAQTCTRYCFRQRMFLGELSKHRVTVAERVRGRLEAHQFLLVFLRVNDEVLHVTKRVPAQELLQQMRFVWPDVVTQKASLAAQARVERLQDRAVGHADKRVPPVEHDEFGPQAIQGTCSLNPRQRIRGIDDRLVVFTDGICAFVVLRLTGEQQAGILAPKRDEFDAMAQSQVPDEER